MKKFKLALVLITILVIIGFSGCMTSNNAKKIGVVFTDNGILVSYFQEDEATRQHFKYNGKEAWTRDEFDYEKTSSGYKIAYDTAEGERNIEISDFKNKEFKAEYEGKGSWNLNLWDITGSDVAIIVYGKESIGFSGTIGKEDKSKSVEGSGKAVYTFEDAESVSVTFQKNSDSNEKLVVMLYDTDSKEVFKHASTEASYGTVSLAEEDPK